MRKAVILALMILILSSCNPERTGTALVSDGGISVYLKEGSRVRLISSGSVKAEYLKELSGKDIESAVAELFSLDEDDIHKVDADSYRLRWQMLRRLMTATASSSPEMALWENAEDLEKTGFMDNMDTLSGSFDSSLLDDFPVGGDDYAEYRVERILGNAPSWNAAVDFMKRWIDSAFGVDYEE